MQGEYILTPQDREDIRTHKLMPVKDVHIGGRYHYRAKVGGEATLITVQVKEMSEKPHNLGGKIRTAYVFGAGFRGWVNQKKLLENRKKRTKRVDAPATLCHCDATGGRNMAMERIVVFFPTEIVEFLSSKARKTNTSLSDEIRKRVLANIEWLSEMEWDEAQCKWVEVKQDKVTA